MLKSSALFFLFVLCFQVHAAEDDGSCSCKGGVVSALGDSGTKACRAARDNCESTFVDFCADDCECNSSAKRCKKKSTIVDNYPRVFSSGGGKTTYQCRVNCIPMEFKCVKPGGKKDPHFTDFNGKHFDFHGRAGGKYVMFGRQDGDLLVSGMVEKLNPDALTNTVIKKTFFNEFGIRTSSGRKVVIRHGLATNGLKKSYRAIVFVDGSNIEKDLKTEGLSFSFNEDYRNVVVKTDEMNYFFKAVSKKNNEHLDFHMSLLRTPEVTDRFVGVLGMSLNTKIGHEVRTPLKISKGYDKEEWENTLRKEFEVSSLHPYLNTAFKMHGVVRMSEKSLSILEENYASASMEE